MIFLIHYDRSEGRIVALRAFAQEERASAEDARLQLELALSRAAIEQEVVLLEAASEGALRKTHRRYFANLTELATPLAGETPDR